MTQRETTAIALKCFAIYLLSQICIAVPAFVIFSIKLGQIPNDKDYPTLNLFIPAMTLLFGIIAFYLLWKIANKLLLGAKEESSDSSSINQNEVIKLVITCMGLLFSLRGLVALPTSIANYHFLSMDADNAVNIFLINLSSPILKILIGLSLIAKPRQWIKALRAIGEK